MVLQINKIIGRDELEISILQQPPILLFAAFRKMFTSSSSPRITPFEREDSSTDALLEKTYQLDANLEHGLEQPQNKQPRWFPVVGAATILHMTIFMVYTVIFLISMDNLGPRGEGRLLYSPARDAVKYQRKLISAKINTTNDYKGPPSKEIDDKWGKLFQYSNIRVSPDVLKAANRTSVPLSDGSGDYLATLDVYHQLHCLKYIRHYVHQEYYKLKSTNVPNQEHVDHCIDMLRQVVMCKADVTLITYSWLPDFQAPWPNFEVQHDCRNFDAIDQWSKERSIDIYDPKYLIHPTLGSSYATLAGINLTLHHGG